MAPPRVSSQPLADSYLGVGPEIAKPVVKCLINFLEFLIPSSRSNTNSSRNSFSLGLATGEFKKHLNNSRFLLSIAKFALHAESIPFFE
jgi:hypothetical protein